MQRNHVILSVTIVAVLGALVWRSRATTARAEQTPLATLEASGELTDVEPEEALPRLVELGADSCASCKAMIPVLAELRAEHAGELDVDFIDVWKYPDRAKEFEVRVIPTQVFLAPDGSELARHEGFYAAAAIREHWGELGFPLHREPKAP